MALALAPLPSQDLLPAVDRRRKDRSADSATKSGDDASDRWEGERKEEAAEAGGLARDDGGVDEGFAQLTMAGRGDGAGGEDGGSLFFRSVATHQGGEGGVASAFVRE